MRNSDRDHAEPVAVQSGGSRIVVAVLAHNEERRIGACLDSLPLDAADVEAHVIVNGSTDRTAHIARQYPVKVHDWKQGGKSRSWNRFALDQAHITADAFVFVDGDAEVSAGSIHALARTLAANRGANAVAAMPGNGRRAEHYRREMVAKHTMFGDLYALSGEFVARMRRSGIRLPEDLIGDDGLICALAKSDLAGESNWREDRVPTCAQASFLCEPVSLVSPSTLALQYRRMINYSVRHFQNRIITQIMRTTGPEGLPHRMAELYSEWLPAFEARKHPVWWWFDGRALERLRLASG